MAKESSWTDHGYSPEEHGWWRATLDGRSDFGYPAGFYYADTVRAIMTSFARFFNDVCVVRFDERGFPRKTIHVPLKFGPRAKSHDFRVEQESGQPYVIPLPNMYYKITSFQYDSTRSASSKAIRTFYEEYMMSKGIEESQTQLLWQDTQPVPYNIGVELTAKAEKFSDILQIVEQISSRFDPDAFLYIKEFWFMNIRRDIKMKLDTVSLDYQDDFGEQDKRELEAKFNFTIEGQVYTKIEHGSIIDQIVVKLSPAIAVWKDQTIEITVSGAPDEKKFYIGTDSPNWLVESSAVKQIGMVEPDVGLFEPADGFSDKFFKVDRLSESDPQLWKFTSSFPSEVADPYRSVIGTSGNYLPESGSYDEETRTWQGSMTERYDFESLAKSGEYSSSGRLDYLNSANQKVDTHWFSTHEIEDAQ